MQYVIGSFNISNMNRTKDFDAISRIIIQSQFDVIAIQEVTTNNAIKDLVNALNLLQFDSWEGVCESADSYFQHSNEWYGYIWNKKKLSLIGEPWIVKKYKSKGICEDGLVRPPYVARFSPSGLLGGSFFEIRLINTHILFSKPEHAQDELRNEALRRKELDLIAKRIYTFVADKRYGDNLPAYTFLLGDYNLCLVGNGPRIDVAIDMGCNRILKNDQFQPTSLKTPQGEEVTKDEQTPTQIEFYANNYDHFSYESTMDSRLSFSISRATALEDYLKGFSDKNEGLKEFRGKVSDHVPIKMVLNLRTKDVFKEMAAMRVQEVMPGWNFLENK